MNYSDLSALQIKFTLKTKKKSLLRVARFVFRAVRLRSYCLPSWSGCFCCIAFRLRAVRFGSYVFFLRQNFSEWNARNQTFKQPFFLATCSVKASSANILKFDSNLEWKSTNLIPNLSKSKVASDFKTFLVVDGGGLFSAFAANGWGLLSTSVLRLRHWLSANPC